MTKLQNRQSLFSASSIPFYLVSLISFFLKIFRSYMFFSFCPLSRSILKKKKKKHHNLIYKLIIKLNQCFSSLKHICMLDRIAYRMALLFIKETYSNRIRGRPLCLQSLKYMCRTNPSIQVCEHFMI